uniref:Protein hunchback n=1 Tax=Anopheles epiroticus TaxID=199890 RepID=A0A182PME6_9DIPT
MRFDTFGGDYAKPQLTQTVTLPMPMAQQLQQQTCKCEFCEYLQANRISLTGDHSFQCEFCGEGFSSQTSYNRHRCGSTDIQIYRCENCRQEYGSSRAVSSIGNCEPRDKCDICNRNIVQSLPEEQAAYGPSVTTGGSHMTSQTTTTTLSDGTIGATVHLPSMIAATSPDVSNESVSDLSANVNVGSIESSPIEQHDLSSIDPFGSDSECLDQFFAAEPTSTSHCTAASSTITNVQCQPMPTSANIGNVLSTTTLHQPESAKTYFLLGNVDQLQQFHAATGAVSATVQQLQPGSTLPSITNSFHHLHLAPAGPGSHQPQQQLPLSLQNAPSVTVGTFLPSEHEVTSLQQYDQYDDEDYSSMSEDEAIVPIEPYAKSPNQDHAKTELPIQETIVDTSTGITVLSLPQFAMSGLPRDDASMVCTTIPQGVVNHLQLQHQQQQQHQSPDVPQPMMLPDEEEEGKCDSSSSSLGLLAGASSEMAFVDSRALAVHARLHSGERLKCEKCEKTFSSVSALTVHNRLHTGIHPYKCDLCGKTFPQYNNLKHHMKKHEQPASASDNQASPSGGTALSNGVSTTSGPEIVVSGPCGASVSTRDMSAKGNV